MTVARKTITLTRRGCDYLEVRVEKYGRTRFMWLDELLTLAADNPVFAEALERTLSEAQARLRATREREAAKVVSLADRRTT